ncbi:MAG: hypothetical protein ACYS0D_06420 [Planctomycetota bacterium]|jgi:hypothetical protein
MIAATANVIAACVALAAFAVAVVAGLFGGSDSAAILLRALLSMLVCYPIGLAIGGICQRVLVEHVREQALQASDDIGAEQSAQSAEVGEVEGDV